MRRLFKTYTTALTARFAICSAVPIVVIGVVVYVVLYQSVLTERRHGGALLARAVANEFTDHLHAPRQQLRQSAMMIADGGLSGAAVDTFLVRVVKTSEFFDAVLLVDAQRRVSHVGLAAPEALDREDLIGLDLSRQPFWAEPDGVAWSDAFFSVTRGDVSLALVVPCGTQRLVGIVDLERFSQILQHQVSPLLHGPLLVLDRNGTVVFSADRQQALQRDNLRNLPPIAAGLAGQGEQSAPLVWDGETYQTATVTIAATGWVVFYAQPNGEVFAGLNQVVKIIGVGMLIALAAALLTAWILGRRIVRHLDVLAAQAEMVARGGYRGEPMPDTYRELARLHGSIAAMAEAIAEREEQLRRSSEYYRTLFHGNSDGVCVYLLGEAAEHCRFVEANQTACSRLGYSREELLRLGPAEIIDETAFGAGGFASMLAELRAKGGLLTEVVLNGHDGRRVPVEVSAHVIDFAGGKAVLSVERDISERRQTAELIHTLYQGTVGVTGDAFFTGLVKALSDWLAVDYAAIALLDTDREHVQQLAVCARGELGQPQRIPLAELPCGRLLEGGRCHQARRAWEAFPESSKLRDLAIEGYFGLSLKDKDGVVVGLLSMMSTRELHLPPHAHEVLDILAARAAAELDRLLVEGARARSEMRYRRIFDHASDALFLIGADGRVRDANEVASRYLGTPRELLIGMPWAAIEPTSGRSASSIACQLLEDGSLSYEGGLDGGDEEPLPVWIRARLLEIENEELVLASARDLRQRKATEREMAAARRAAEEANAAKSRFLANMSHEIRTPMSGVIGMLDLTLATPLDEERQGWLRMARNSAEGLMRVINDLLDLARIEAGKLSIEESSFDLCALLSEVCAPFAVEAEKKGLAFSWRIDDGLECGRRGDAGRLRQVLVNLLGNALKFTHTGSISLQVRVSGTAIDATRLRFEVSDSGIGIPADKRALLFHPFSQVEDTPTRHYGGSGLGLAISREIVEAQGGIIGVTGEEGHGSTFFFEISFPLAPIVAAVPARIAIDAGRPLRLLIVEDNLINRRLIEVFVVKHGWTSRSVGDGLAAIEAWRSERFDLILMDVQMPQLDGLETTRRIRSAEIEAATGEHVPIIALTAYAMEEDRARCLAAGMDAFIHKPIHFDDFFQLCRKLTDRTGVDGSGERDDS